MAARALTDAIDDVEAAYEALVQQPVPAIKA
jgi:hypothetical protein